jgi:flavin-dependent dehydrogenase
MIHKDGPRRLREWGLLDRIVDAGTPPVDTVTTCFGDFPLVARHVGRDGLAWGYAPRRRLLDELLIEAAVVAGAEFREGVSVDGLTFDRDRVTGITGRSGASVVNERATITIGADGRHSRVAAAAGAHCDEQLPAICCYYFSYWSDVAGDGMEIHHANGRASFAHPTNDGLFAVFMAFPIAEFKRVRADIEGHFMAAADAFPTLGERLRDGRREEPFYGAADLPNIRRRPFGCGWSLVGDAGCHKDPYMALGISDAFRDAALLSDAVDAGLSGRCAMPDALEAYERQRNESSIADYRENLACAKLEPPSADVLALRAALKHDPVQTTRFFQARAGLIPHDAFFNPETLSRLMA